MTDTTNNDELTALEQGIYAILPDYIRVLMQGKLVQMIDDFEAALGRINVPEEEFRAVINGYQANGLESFSETIAALTTMFGNQADALNAISFRRLTDTAVSYVYSLHRSDDPGETMLDRVREQRGLAESLAQSIQIHSKLSFDQSKDLVKSFANQMTDQLVANGVIENPRTAARTDTSVVSLFKR